MYKELLKNKANDKRAWKDIPEEELYEILVNDKITYAECCDLYGISFDQLKYRTKALGINPIMEHLCSTIDDITNTHYSDVNVKVLSFTLKEEEKAELEKMLKKENMTLSNFVRRAMKAAKK